jgi:hypothetical protein
MNRIMCRIGRQYVLEEFGDDFGAVVWRRSSKLPSPFSSGLEAGN